MKFALTTLSFAIAGALCAQNQDVVCYYDDPGKHERNRNIDVTFMKLEVSFLPKEGKVNGRVTHVFTGLQDQIDTVFLDGPGIVITKALMDGKEIKTRNNKEGIIIEAGLKNAL